MARQNSLQQLLFLMLLFALVSTLHPPQVTAVKPIPDPKSQFPRSENFSPQRGMVDAINADPGAGWTAAKNPFYAVSQLKRMLGAKQWPSNAVVGIPVIVHSQSVKSQLPKSFDARTAWSHCRTIGRILDQGHCGSCWAFGAVESLSDRFCVHFGLNTSLSVNDLLSCCGSMCGNGCDGGYPIMAWQYFVEHGVVSDECDPYFDRTGCAHPGCEPEYQTPACKKHCIVDNQSWQGSKRFGMNAYRIVGDQYDIMAELYTNGPLEVSFTVYEDFAYYKSGVYKHITGEEMGGHAVKLIGWGTGELGDYDYWLLANQWNRGWGDDGYFKVARGRNECGIEEEAVAGLPSAKNLVPSAAKVVI